MSAADASEPTMRQHAVKGSLWTLLGYGASQVLRLASNLILARLLFPEAFGLMALVNVFLQGLQMFSDIGIGPSIIQNPRGEDPVFLRTAWTVQVIRGFLLWAVCWAGAPLAAVFFGASDPMAYALRWLLPVAGLTAVLGGFTSTSVYTLNRKLDMAKVTLLELGPQGVSLAVMAVWAVYAPSVWALVGGGLVFSGVRLGLSHVMNEGPRDGFGWEREARRELFGFGRWVFLSTVVAFLSRHLDRLMLGKLLSLEELGLYSIAMTLARVAIHTSTRLSSAVIFPLLSRYREKPVYLVGACLKARRAVLWLSGAVCCGFALFAPLFFETLYDPRYAGAGQTSRWLALYTWSHVLVASMDRIPLALGKPRQLFVANGLTVLGMGLAAAGYARLGLPGFIVGMAGAEWVALGFLVWRLPAKRLAMLGQSAGFTLGYLLYALVAMRGLEGLEPRVHLYVYGLTVCAAAGVPILAAAGRVWFLIRHREEGA